MKWLAPTVLKSMGAESPTAAILKGALQLHMMAKKKFTNCVVLSFVIILQKYLSNKALLKWKTNYFCTTTKPKY